LVELWGEYGRIENLSHGYVNIEEIKSVEKSGAALRG
jgi:hypothetical protein